MEMEATIMEKYTATQCQAEIELYSLFDDVIELDVRGAIHERQKLFH